MVQNIIVKLKNGEEKTGEVMQFNTSQPIFRMRADRDDGTKEALTIAMDAVKAILFLKSEEDKGTRLRPEAADQSAESMDFRLVIEFQDGEVMSGSASKYNSKDKGFYITTLDPSDKIERIYVNAQSLKHVECKKILGKILVDQNKITEHQLRASLIYQREQRGKKIGAILKEQTIINDEQLYESLTKQRETNKKLGEILIEAGYIAGNQFDHVLSIQQEKRERRLGQILVELKYLTPADICLALATQFRMPWVDLSRIKITPEIAASLPEDVIKKLEVIPVEKKGDGTIVVATSRPQDSEILDDLKKSTEAHIELVVAYEGYIIAAINEFYP